MFYILAECVCTAEYGITVRGVLVGAYCDNWDDDGQWCYLQGGLKASKCPGALLSSVNDGAYWSNDPATCQAAESNRKHSK